MKKPSWSYTALNQFTNCPRQYQLTRVTKEVVQVPSEEMKWGNEVHKHLELRILDGKQLPDSLNSFEPIVTKILSKGGEVTAERKLAIDAEFKPVTWFDKSAWCRGIVDVGMRKGGYKWVGDWKTGKRRPDSDQLMLFAAMEMHHDETIEKVTTSFIWLKDKKIDSQTYVRDQLTDIWKHFMPKIVRLETAYEKDAWPAKPSGLCGWCPATKAHCDFAKR